MREPGPLIASGRDSDIFEYGEGLVLRRSRRNRSMADEAKVMEHARSFGYPAPKVSEVSEDGTTLVMERIDGPLMVEALARRPWTFGAQARTLGELHRRLHEIEGPEWLRRAPGRAGDRLVHLDLHPLNVILSPSGPVLIDWANAARGDPAVDVALTWILLASGELPEGNVRAAVLGRFRDLFVRLFLRHVDRAAVVSHVREVVEWKVQDPNMSDTEQAAMWRLVDKVERAAPGA